MTATFSPVGVQTVGACEAHPTPVQINAWDQALVLGMDGNVWAWGDNTQGKVGDGTKTHRYEPVKVLDDVKDISASKGSFSVALKNNGTVWTWGSNAGGALGNGSTVAKSIVPVQVPGLENVKQIGAGVFTGYALKNDGTVWAWGLNTKGELGNGGNGSQSNVPVQVENLADIVERSAGLDYAMALKSDGTVWAWGRDVGNILADGTNTSETYLKPVWLDIGGA